MPLASLTDRRQFLAGALALGAGLAAPLMSRAGAPEIYAEGGLALRGADVVAYFTEGLFLPGRPDMTLRWRGVTWRFATDRHRERFEMDPKTFLPRFGGWCAYHMADGQRVAPNPAVFVLQGSALYLMQDPVLRDRWIGNAPGLIRAAEGNWQPAPGP
ncbi:MAG: YHS domain protein [Rubellimicrobium sp.]|nr:YHS domain protein [Rubellimicrobium sp.]